MIEIEKAILGTIIQNPSLLDKAVAWIRHPECFTRVENRKIWITLLELDRQNIPIDSATIYNKAKEKFKGEINAVYITEVMALNKPEFLNEYSKILWKNRLEKEAGRLADEIKIASKKKSNSLDELLNRWDKYLQELKNLQPSREKSFDAVLETATKNILEGGNIIEYGLGYLDHSAGGATRGELTVLGGRPGHGKTTLMLTILDALVQQGLKITLFNREMTNTEAVKKLMVLNSNKLEYNHLRKKVIGNATKEEVLRLKSIVSNKYKNVRMYDDIRELDESLREIKRFRPDVFIDDYIQLDKVHGKKIGERRFEIETIMNEYKWIAKETNSHGILISQLSRDIEKRIDQTPTMGDYAEGGTIEQLAESCWFIFYGYNFDAIEYSPNESELIVKKARYGEIGSYRVGFNGNKCKFYEIRGQ